MAVVRSQVFFVLFISLLFSTGIIAQPSPEGGVSANLATYRKIYIQEIKYDLLFHLPPQRETPIAAEETLSFTLHDSIAVLALDFKEKTSPGEITVNGIKIAVNHQDEHLYIPPASLHPGPNTIHILFTAGNSPLNRNRDFCYTLLVPDRARTLFPCFDQPDLKAVFTLSLEMPSDWKALGNAPVKDSITEGNTRTIHFVPSDKISTYLFSFAAGKFTRSDQIEDGRPMHFYYRETDSTKLRMSLGPIFRIQADALQFMKEYTGLAFPFQKFDFVAIPDFQFGGMEHPGAIQYKASALFLDSGATRDQIIGRSNVLSHETAHMWFGDLVTMSWFNDVWMKEVFANFMADKISNITLPDGKYDLKFLTDHFPAAYSIDRTAGAHPIRQQLDNLQDAGSLYGNIIYHKAPIMMRQLERLMGPDAFRDGLRDYLKTYAGGNASWPDLVHQLAGHTAVDLEAWNKVWVNEPGRPRFTYRLKREKGKIANLEIRQQGEDGTSRIWPQLFQVILVYPSGLERLTVNMKDSVVFIPAAVGKEQPMYVLFNTDGQGYGLFPIDLRSLPWIFQTAASPVSAARPATGSPATRSPAAGSSASPSQSSAFKGLPATTSLLRASAYINVYENMLDGQSIRPRQLLALEMKALSKETEELNLNLLTDQLISIYWRFLSPATRDSLSAGLEKEVWQAMLSAGTGNEKKLLFKTYTNIVLSRQGQDRLFFIWNKQQPPAGVKLSEEDYTNLATALALRAYPGEQKILQQQLARITNEDRRQRLLYLLPALSNDIRERDRFFDSLTTAGGRKKEAWVLTGLSYLHHPLRTTVSEKYLAKSLDLLEEIQRTGDVFFPQSWLQVSFGWYRTRTAAEGVRRFLQQHPDYNPKLKAKILQATDYLFRASK